MFIIPALGIVLLLGAVMLLDLWLDRVMVRALFRILDRLPPIRRGGRYQSKSMSDRYQTLLTRRRR